MTPPQGEEHSGEVGILNRELVLAYGRSFTVRPQCPLRGAPSSMPEPNLAVVRGDAASYLARYPTGADVVLLIEVSKTTLAYDRRKAALYAKMGVKEYWLVDVDGRRIEVRTGPMKDGEYEITRNHRGNGGARAAGVLGLARGRDAVSSAGQVTSGATWGALHDPAVDEVVRPVNACRVHTMQMGPLYSRQASSVCRRPEARSSRDRHPADSSSNRRSFNPQRCRSRTSGPRPGGGAPPPSGTFITEGAGPMMFIQ